MGDFRHKKILQILLIVFIILISGFFIYRIHYGYSGLIQNPYTEQVYEYVNNSNYPFPIHADEWTHLAQIEAVMDGKFFINPYSPTYINYPDYEIGFHLSIAAFFVITHLDLILFYQFLPAIFFVLNAILLFFFVKKLTKNYYIALFSILFFLAIPSNINFLGNWFAIPLTFSIFSIYLFFICLINFIETKKKKYLIAAIISYTISLCYPIATILITLITFFYLLFKIEIYKNKIPKNLLLISSIALLTLIILENCFSIFLFSKEWTSFQYNYSLIFFYGIIPTILAIIGIYFLIHKKFSKLLIIWPAICLLNLLGYKIINVGVFIPYERTLFYFLLGLVPLAAIGLFYFFESIYIFIKKFPFKYKKIFALILILLIAFAIFFFIFKNYYTISEKELSLLRIADQHDYDALKFLENNYGNGHIILADNLVSIAVYPISKNYIVGMQGSNLGYGDPEISRQFFESDCDNKKKIINQYNVDFVLSRFKINCDFLEEFYNKGDYIYGTK